MCYVFFILTISTRGRRSLPVLILQFTGINSEFVGLSCLFLSVRLSRVFTSRLLSNYCRDSAGAVFYTNGRRSFCACEQNGGLMWSQPIRF